MHKIFKNVGYSCQYYLLVFSRRNSCSESLSSKNYSVDAFVKPVRVIIKGRNGKLYCPRTSAFILSPSKPQLDA